MRFSYVGKKTKYVPVKPGEDLLMVTLEDESQIMEEIVVTGYQQMKRESATDHSRPLARRIWRNAIPAT